MVESLSRPLRFSKYNSLNYRVDRSFDSNLFTKFEKLSFERIHDYFHDRFFLFFKNSIFRINTQRCDKIRFGWKVNFPSNLSGI